MIARLESAAEAVFPAPGPAPVPEEGRGLASADLGGALGPPGDPGGEAVTHDTLLRGRVHIIQPARGYRTSLDPVLLAAFVRRPVGRFLDLGCGTGAVAFVLLARDPEAVGVGVEIQPRLARLAAAGAAANGWQGRFAVLAADVRELARAARGDGDRFDLIATNPPYRPLGTGILPPDPERSIAHHEVQLRLPDWLDAAEALLTPTGRLAVIFPAARLEELRAALAARRFGPTRLRLVRPRPGAPATRLMVEAHRGPGGALVIEPPLVVHDGTGFSPEVSALLG